MTTFPTTIAGIPCLCRVDYYQAAEPYRVNGATLEAPEEQEFEYTILDRRGRAAPWLARKVKRTDEKRLLEEYHDTL